VAEHALAQGVSGKEIGNLIHAARVAAVEHSPSATA
jgi:hypothetical protein